MTQDTTRRTVVKTISWRIAGSASTFSISYLILGNLTISSTIAVIQLTLNTVLYYIHERIWNKVNWGKN